MTTLFNLAACSPSGAVTGLRDRATRLVTSGRRKAWLMSSVATNPLAPTMMSFIFPTWMLSVDCTWRLSVTICGWGRPVTTNSFRGWHQRYMFTGINPEVLVRAINIYLQAILNAVPSSYMPGLAGRCSSECRLLRPLNSNHCRPVCARLVNTKYFLLSVVSTSRLSRHTHLAMLASSPDNQELEHSWGP